MVWTKTCWPNWRESSNQGDDICGVGDFPALAFGRTFGVVNSAGLPRMPSPRARRSLRSRLISVQSAHMIHSFSTFVCRAWTQPLIAHWRNVCHGMPILMHDKRRWSVSSVASPEELARMLTERTWTLCSGFTVAGHERYMFLNDATSEDGAGEFGIVKVEGGAVSADRIRDLQLVPI